MPTIAETTVEKIEMVFPEHAGAPGQIHGGRMMQWITEAGTMAAARMARGQVVLGAMDDIDFLHPVKVGEIAILRAQVEYIGRSSLEVGVRVWAENVNTGARSVTLNSHLVFVSVGDDIRPRPVRERIEPRGAAEMSLVEAARQRREQRLTRWPNAGISPPEHNRASRSHFPPRTGHPRLKPGTRTPLQRGGSSRSGLCSLRMPCSGPRCSRASCSWHSTRQ